MDDKDGVVDVVYIVVGRKRREEKNSPYPLAAFAMSKGVTSQTIIDGI